MDILYDIISIREVYRLIGDSNEDLFEELDELNWTIDLRNWQVLDFQPHNLCDIEPSSFWNWFRYAVDGDYFEALTNELRYEARNLI